MTAIRRAGAPWLRATLRGEVVEVERGGFPSQTALRSVRGQAVDSPPSRHTHSRALWASPGTALRPIELEAFTVAQKEFGVLHSRDSCNCGWATSAECSAVVPPFGVPDEEEVRPPHVSHRPRPR